MYMPVPAMIQAMIAPSGPVAPAKVRGRENMPAPTMLPITIAVSWMRDILPSAAAMRSVPSSRDVLAALFHLYGAVKSARGVRETAARPYHSRPWTTQLESHVHTGPSPIPALAGGIADPVRRRFVTGLATGGALLALGPAPGRARAAGTGAARELAGSSFELAIGATPVNFTGRTRPAITVNGTLPGPVLRWRQGDTVTLRVTNRLPGHYSSIHWHGILLPANMDGVPGLSFDGIAPGETFTYRFNLRQAGTYWYHSHSMFQEQAGLYGALVVDPAEPHPYAWDREHVVLLSDWTDLDPGALFRRLKKFSEHDNWYQPTVADFVRDARANGWREAFADRAAWGRMRMTPSDISDVNAHTYTYLLNGTTPDGNWTGLYRSGEKVLLRFINASAMTYFDVRIPGLKMTVVAADGQPIHPVSVDEFRIAVAETFDVLVEPTGQDAWTIFAQDTGRTGYARGTLAVREGLRPPVPVLDPRPLLTMADMGHGGHAEHGGQAAQGDHGGHGAHGAGMQAHPPAETGHPLVDMQTHMPAPKLDDPGIGLRDNGRRTLTYADMRSLSEDPDGREPGRTVELHLTGHMH